MTTDPVCGMRVDEKDAAAETEHEGRIYYFCSMSCRDKFIASPHRYAAKEEGGRGHGGRDGCC